MREIAALMTGVILAGRVGAAFAAQIGSMQANEEIDALRTLGIDPVDHLVLPRLLAMVLVAPLLTAMAALVGLCAGWAVAVAVFGIPPMEYLTRSLPAVTATHLGIGLFKGSVYAMLVALAGCRQGLAFDILAGLAAVRLQARWALTDPAARSPAALGRVDFDTASAGPGPAALVAAQRAALWQLAQRIAADGPVAALP